MLKKKKPPKPSRDNEPGSILAMFQRAPKGLVIPPRSSEMISSYEPRPGLSSTRQKRWQLQEAKAKFSQVVDEMLDKGPQVITRHGKDIAALIPIKDLHKVTAPTSAAPKAKRGRNSLAYLLKCPKGPDLQIRRNPDDNVLNRPPVFD